MNETTTGNSEPRDAFNRLLGELRPKLHRYCARMTGSVVDGEDVVQEALIKAIAAFPGTGQVANQEGWMFRIAHNAALDFLRRRARHDARHADQELDMIADPGAAADDRDIAAVSLRTFMRLPVAQRSSVILMDVLGYTAQEIGGIMNSTLPAVKAALHRGRTQLREFAKEPDDQPVPVLDGPERLRLARYVERFNARDFDTLRDMLADEVRLELVNRLRLSGRSEVGNYFHNYSRVHDWQLVPGLVDRHPAVLVRDPDDVSGKPRYFVLLDWTEDRVVAIRDFRYARYAAEGAEFIALG
ncbi:MAG TPA: sigma-70 family RNA polymerase sigma factor [Alphaproteobacteria bacterium]